MISRYKRFLTDSDVEPDAGPDIEEQRPPDDAVPESEQGSSAKEKNESPNLASVTEVFSFGSGPKKRFGLCFGIIGAILTGCVYPALAFILSNTLRTLSAPTEGELYLKDIRNVSFIFMGLGVFSFLSMTLQSTLLDTAAGEMTYSLKTSWFDALLRQDISYFDIKDVSGTATMISSAGQTYQAGVGPKMGEGIQFFVCFIGGFIYAFYASWRTSLILLAVVPVMSISVLFAIKTTQSQTKRSNESYAEAGSIVYMAVSAIKTVYSLNACREMIQKYTHATQQAYQAAVSRVALLGLANGMVMGSIFGLRNIVLTLYGAFLLYNQVRTTGCDPSGNLEDVNPSGICDPDGTGVFGALIGITMGAAGLPRISVALEAFTHSRAACKPALDVMNRTVDQDDETTSDTKNISEDGMDRSGSMILPKYVIDSSSEEGKKPLAVDGVIEFRNVSFAYPTRRENLVFDGFSLSVEAGQTVALVGPSGCGKSTTVSLLERFYDPTSGSITLDGTDLRELNVRWLRDQIGVVSQEPTLFARSIAENIAYGCPGATRHQIEEAAEMANAHDFITSFPDGYETQVGDLGGQLSGGQKQRIAIARAILKRAKILLFDEATSALDSESEKVVQAALDKLLESSNVTTIVIAHRLSTIRDANLIAVVDDGRIVEKGSHDELMALKGQYHELVEAQTLPNHAQNSVANGTVMEARGSTRESFVGVSHIEETAAEQAQLVMQDVHFCYPTRKQNMIFRGLNLTVRRGETLAICGPSGGGKSTVVSLIERFYDPTSGSIRFDGVDLKDYNVGWLRDQMGLVQQEPTLFEGTIGENIRYGNPSATQEEIEEAARRANAHDFITLFPEGYDTYVGSRGTQLSGGQKQRIAIARAISKPRQILLLDEATSALDSESEAVVQSALDKIMEAKSQTAIVVAHRLSTLRNADRVAVLADGRVSEIGTHEELLAKSNGRYKRLSMFQSLDGGNNSKIKSLMAQAVKDLEEEEQHKKSKLDGDEETVETEEEVEEDQGDTDKGNVHRARLLAKNDAPFFLIGSVGAVLAGLIFPATGVLFGYTIELIYRPVPGCDIPGFPSCEYVANEMQHLSFKVSYGWLGVMGCTLIGNVLLYYGFGKASERMNKRIRDAAFGSLIRQECAYFDKRTVGTITSQLQDDAAKIHAFSGEPIRTLFVSVASLLVGLVISFVFMWPFALLALATLPFMAFGAKMKVRSFMGQDEGAEADGDQNSPGGIVVETLLNMRTVASLNIEEMRSKEYKDALKQEEPTPIKSSFLDGVGAGLGQLVQSWGLALLFWWGGWLMYTYPGTWEYRDFLVSMFSLLISISGVAFGTQGTTDKDEAKMAAKRIFRLIDRQSAIDPLGDKGKNG